MEKLRCTQNRDSTIKNYLSIWRHFNNFVIQLDRKPNSWEERTSLFMAHLISGGTQSSTIRSYVSAIKRILIDDGYQWNEKQILLSSLTRACKLINDHVRTRLPIQSGLLELILFELNRKFKTQPYLIVLYQAVFSLGYYGLLRVGELTVSQNSSHTIKARDIHLATNKEKLLVVLYSSKTHGKGSVPQKVKICSNRTRQVNRKAKKIRHFCPFILLGKYLDIRKDFDSNEEPFFVHSDGSPLMATQTSLVLKETIGALGLNEELYSVHSLRIGRASEMAKIGYSIDEIKRIGRWRSSSVYRYIRQ